MTWVAFYNHNVGDVLMLTRGEIPAEHLQVDTKGNITCLMNKETQTIMGLNFFAISQDIVFDNNGPQTLNEEHVAILQDKLKEQAIDLRLDWDQTPKFVVGYVEACKPHEDSDHLSVTQVNVGTDKPLQIVCGASNIAQDMYVLVAKDGAVMPSGAIIFDGELRGVKSFGMICSTRELDLTDIEDKPGIWILNHSFEPGTPLEDVVRYYHQ